MSARYRRSGPPRAMPARQLSSNRPLAAWLVLMATTAPVPTCVPVSCNCSRSTTLAAWRLRPGACDKSAQLDCRRRAETEVPWPAAETEATRIGEQIGLQLKGA
jgi:hypothetical protein